MPLVVTLAHMDTIAVLGTGIMGAPMARNLLAAGYPVRVWNRTAEKARPLSDNGAVVADSPARAVAGADVIITMLLDADSVAGVIERAASGLAPGTLWLQMATVGVDGDRLTGLADELGLRYVDAPVLGTKQPAEKGELVVLAAPPAFREQAQPLVDVLGTRTVWLDEAGQASRLKLVVNTWIGGLTALLGEVFALADGLDVDPRRFLEAVDGGPVGAPYAHIKGELMIAGDYPTSFPVRHVVKDLSLITDAAAGAGVGLRVAEAVAERFRRALEEGYGDEDMAAVRRVVGGG